MYVADEVLLVVTGRWGRHDARGENKERLAGGGYLLRARPLFGNLRSPVDSGFFLVV